MRSLGAPIAQRDVPALYYARPIARNGLKQLPPQELVRKGAASGPTPDRLRSLTRALAAGLMAGFQLSFCAGRQKPLSLPGLDQGALRKTADRRSDGRLRNLQTARPDRGDHLGAGRAW